MPDPWTAAWEEAEVSVPPEVYFYYTLELQHPAFVDLVEGAFAARVVTGTPDDQLLTLEAGAELNGGEEVNFQAVMFWAELPEFAEGKTPESAISIDNVVDVIGPYLEAAVTLRADMKAIYRVWRSDDRDEPCYGPIEFIIKNIQVKGTRLEGTAKIDDLSNKKFPNKVYTFNQFPGLMNG